jgi:hypothetical protein
MPTDKPRPQDFVSGPGFNIPGVEAPECYPLSFKAWLIFRLAYQTTGRTLYRNCSFISISCDNGRPTIAI